MTTKTVTRVEDMSRDGTLELIRQDDGDIIVTVRDEDGSGASVEFCLSGNGSPNTQKALHALFVAMERDNLGQGTKIGCANWAPVHGGGYCANCLVDGDVHAREA